MTRLPLILILAVAVLVPTFGVGSAQAARKMEVVVQDDAIFLYKRYYDRVRAFTQLRDLGASRLRMNVLWWDAIPDDQARAKTKPRALVYDWAQWDEAIALAKAYGIKVQLDLTGDPPRWACGRDKVPGECKGYKPDAKQFGLFAREAARHFGRNVDRYSIWNEPNWFTWLAPRKQSPLLYRELYRAGYEGIKRGNRRAKVLMGETAPYAQKCCATAPLQFIREIFCLNKRFKRASSKCKGGPLKTDGYAHHPYDFKVAPTKKRPSRDDVTMANLTALSDTLDRLVKSKVLRGSVKKLPIYLTEYGYFVKGERRLPESKRAKYTVKGYDMAQRNPRVMAQTYYVFASPPASDPSTFFDLGLLTTDGTPRGAYNRLRGWVQRAARSGRVAKPGRCAASVRSNC